MCYRFPIYIVYVVVIVLGECVVLFQSKPCITNPVSILYISPVTDNKTTHQVAVTEQSLAGDLAQGFRTS